MLPSSVGHRALAGNHITAMDVGHQNVVNMAPQHFSPHHMANVISMSSSGSSISSKNNKSNTNMNAMPNLVQNITDYSTRDVASNSSVNQSSSSNMFIGAQDTGYCIVCGTIQNMLSSHMLDHSKEDMISALMGRDTPNQLSVNLQSSSIMSPGPSSSSYVAPSPQTNFLNTPIGEEMKPSMAMMPSLPAASQSLPVVFPAPAVPALLPQQTVHASAFVNAEHEAKASYLQHAPGAQRPIILNKNYFQQHIITEPTLLEKRPVGLVTGYSTPNNRHIQNFPIRHQHYVLQQSAQQHHKQQLQQRQQQFFHRKNQQIHPQSHQQQFGNSAQILQQQQQQQQQLFKKQLVDQQQQHTPQLQTQKPIIPKYFFLGTSNGKAIVSPVANGNNFVVATNKTAISSNSSMPFTASNDESLSKSTGKSIILVSQNNNPQMVRESIVTSKMLFSSRAGQNTSLVLTRPPCYQNTVKNNVICNLQKPMTNIQGTVPSLCVISNPAQLAKLTVCKTNSPTILPPIINDSFSPQLRIPPATVLQSFANPTISNVEPAVVIDQKTTIKVGEHITINVPKDISSKRERLQQLINEELVRGILLNDTKPEIMDSNQHCVVTESSPSLAQDMLAPVISNASCHIENPLTYLKRSSTPNEMKIELFEERIENISYDENSDQFTYKTVDECVQSNTIQEVNQKQMNPVSRSSNHVEIRHDNSDLERAGPSRVTLPITPPRPQYEPEPLTMSKSCAENCRLGVNNMYFEPYSTAPQRSEKQVTEKSSKKKSTSEISTKIFTATSFTDLIKGDFSNDSSCTAIFKKAIRCPSGSSFPSGSSAFKVVAINEEEQHNNSKYAALETKVVDEDSLFSPSSVVSNCETVVSGVELVDSFIESFVTSVTSSCDSDNEALANSSGSRHDEDMSLRAAETLADSDSEHGSAATRSRSLASSRSGGSNVYTDDAEQIDGPESLATSEVLMANLSEESSSVMEQHPRDESSPLPTSSAWTPLRQYSPRHFSRRLQPSLVVFDTPNSSNSSHNTPMDLRQHHSSQQRPENNVAPEAVHQLHQSEVMQALCSNYFSPPKALNTCFESPQSNIGAVFPDDMQCLPFQQPELLRNDANLQTTHRSTNNIHSSLNSSVVNNEGVVLNLDSCTVTPQTLNFSRLFSPNVAGTSGYDVTNCSSHETTGNTATNDILVATSEIMSNMSYFSPSTVSKDLQHNNIQGGDATALEYASQQPTDLHAFDNSFSEANDFNLTYGDPLLSLVSRSPTKDKSSVKRTFTSPRLLGSPQPSTSGLNRPCLPPSLHEQDYEFDYDSDCYADSDNEHHHSRYSVPLEQWKCNVCNKMFKSLKEKLLHAVQHSPHFNLPTNRQPKKHITGREKRPIKSISKTAAAILETKLSKKSSSENVILSDVTDFVEVKREIIKCEPDSTEDCRILDSIPHNDGIQEPECFSKEDHEVDTRIIETEQYECPQCAHTFDCSEDLLEHRKNALQSKLICPICHEVFLKCSRKGTHMKTVHTDSEINCPFCYLTYKNLYNWCRHQLGHLGLVSFECITCGRCFNRAYEYKQHLKTHSGDRPFGCHACDKSFLSESNLRRHLFTHLEGQEVSCESCRKVFKNVRSLLKHKNIVHPLPKRKKVLRDFICSHDDCGLIFSSSKKLLWHKETHQRWPKRCEFCHERFIHNSNLIKHIRTKHNPKYKQEDDENKTCPICLKVLLRTSLPQHMRIHSGIKPFKCFMCSKRFSVKCNLEAHMHTHAGKRDRAFKCNLCPRSFSRQKELESHVRSHKNIRPFTCNECGKSFIHKNNLAMHMKRHVGNKDHKCTECDKAFYRKYNLVNHMRVHTGETPFVCSLCNKRFSQRSNYNVHKRSFHTERHPIHEEL